MADVADAAGGGRLMQLREFMMILELLLERSFGIFSSMPPARVFHSRSR